MLKVINLMTDLHYQNISEKGICAGLTLMWVQAWLSGPEEETKFFNRIDNLINSNRSNAALIEEINAVRNRIKKGVSLKNLTKKEFDLLEIIAFFDGIQLYQKPSKYPEFLLNKPLSQVNAETISAVTASDAIKTLGNLKKIFSAPGVFNKNELELYLDNLCDIISDEYDKLAISISSGQHRFGLRYDKPSGQWVIVEQTLLGGKIEHYKFDPTELVSFIKGIFSTSDNIIFNIDIFATHHRVPSDTVIEKLTRFREEHLNDFNEQRAKRETSHTKMTIAHIAAYYGHLDYLKKYIEFNIPLDQTTSEGYTPIHFAARGNQGDTMDFLVQATKALDVTANDKITAAYIAAEEGFIEMFCKIMTYGANPLLTGPDDKSALDLALENKHMGIVLAILTATKHHNLTHTQFKSLQKYRGELLVECLKFAKTLEQDEQIKYLTDIREGNNALGFIFNHHKSNYKPYTLFMHILHRKTDEITEIAKVLESTIRGKATIKITQ
ncbi:ankyrin repeat domain-containing protein [Legionella clemsonensis]|uniref:Ankyrin repeats (3 copies) n=1 Tax=Legionella clemsonensis TaxID=1867846 RepID=A0A222P5Y7_9GAMM|nr:ankyrin repeat domain-containing protein [Legionella clemsonensis]ASQ47271.1 Ankyrin repeats (3 copies) [Legionella clemsonensis]